MTEKETLNDISYKIIGAAISLHKEHGRRLSPHCYENFLAELILKSGLPVEKRLSVKVASPLGRKHVVYQIDLLVAGLVAVEVKFVKAVIPEHKWQVLNYLKAKNLKLGLILNFKVNRMTDGIYRIVNNFPD